MLVNTTLFVCRVQLHSIILESNAKTCQPSKTVSACLLYVDIFTLP